MATGARRYVSASLGGAAVIGASIVGLHLAQPSGSHADAASISGALPAGCMLRGPLSSCVLPPSTTTPIVRPEAYRNGRYTVTGRYLTPGGAESIGVEMTLEHGSVTAASVQVEAKSPTARQFQMQFASRYAARVVARPSADLGVSRVAGASLTSVGFDDALEQIRAAAHV